ncbi:Peptidyl-prolyl cis-trans isomerase SurA [Jannaschia seosinensis]|uniref:Parvulin-like PPIase n=1 Tax=Jannaschia seosinensis TaxID=313367 RepID=A0A0M7BC41_9RHOB|nr:peptidylprolyl isomerase [Jannaschia seosinensis]CUH39638.1 Peptidyl-prolyl cis-trans isomerase SurA [Jannaschia seosinensis]
MTRLLVAALAAFLAFGAPAMAQNPFSAAAKVNGNAITNYEVQQRALFLSLLRAPGADVESVTRTLVDERLQAQAARAAGIEVADDALQAGLSEFAGRANLPVEEFVAALGRAGVAQETFRDFVRNGLLWRQLVQRRFGPDARPSEAEVTRTLSYGERGDVRLLLSEIALPLTPETQEQVAALADRLSNEIRSEAAFAQAARTYSRSTTAQAGGRLDWVSLSEISPAIAGQVLTLEPGEVSDPVNLGGFIALFQLRGLDETGGAPREGPTVDYAEYLIPGGRSPEALSTAGQLRARVDTCDDLYGIAQGEPAERLIRETRDVSALPADLRQELGRLDPGEVSTRLTAGGNLRFVMLCERPVAPSEDMFQAVGQQILNQRLTSYAQSYLDELRADAVISYE